MSKTLERCRICGNAHLVPILDLGVMHLTGVFPRSPDAPITHGPLTLVKCHAAGDEQVCGLLQLGQTYDLGEMYGDSYGYRSSLNRAMVEHLKGTVQGLLPLVELGPDDVVLDIGSNDGTLLSFYEGLGVARVGIDPTAKKFRRFYQPGIEVVPDFFTAERFRGVFGDKQAKIVTSIAMFYDLEAPIAFMREVGEILHDDGVWHLEFSYTPLMLRKTIYDTICHEHLEYYALKQVQWMAERSGLRIVRATTNDVNGGSLAVTLRKGDGAPSADAAALLAQEAAEGLGELPALEAFAGRVRAHRDALVAAIARIHDAGHRIFGYGASTKGNVLLQYCGITPSQLPCIADVNEEKLGGFTPGTGIPIVSETEARAQQPEYLLVFPWHFKAGIVARETAFLEGGGKLLFPLPEIEVVSR